MSRFFAVPVSYLWVYPWNNYNTFANFVVHGALKCLALLSGDLDDKVVPTLVPVLFPSMLIIVSSPQVCFLVDLVLKLNSLSNISGLDFRCLLLEKVGSLNYESKLLWGVCILLLYIQIWEHLSIYIGT